MIALGIIALGCAESARAGFFSKCTASLGREGGAKAHECIENELGENPNFEAVFERYHCQPGATRKEDRAYCKKLGVVVNEHVANVQTKSKAKAQKHNQKSQNARQLERSKSLKALHEAQGKSGKKATLKRQNSAPAAISRKHSKQAVVEEDDYADQYEDTLERSRNARQKMFYDEGQDEEELDVEEDHEEGEEDEELED